MRNKKKKDHMMIFEKEKQLENKEEEQNDVADGNDEMDAVEADNQEKNKEKKNKKKRKEKKTKNDMIAIDEERKKKKNVKEKWYDVEYGNVEMNVKEVDNQEEKKKKRKEKKTKDDIAADFSKNVKHMSKKVRFSDKLKVFPTTEGSSTSIEKVDGLVRGKRFSREEDKILKKAVFDYIEANDLGEEGLYMVLHCRKFPNILHCWHEIRTALPWRPFLSVYIRAHTLFERGSRKWTLEELELVRKSYEKNGANWTLIAQELGKFRQHVKDAWRRIKLMDVKRGHWSQDEYQTLFELVNKDLQMKVLQEKKLMYRILRDNISWEAISTKLGTRSNANCSQKWYHQLHQWLLKVNVLMSMIIDCCC